MPTWTLRLVACAGFVALLSRLPALDAADAALAAAAASALALAVHFGPGVLRALGHAGRAQRHLPLPPSAFPTRFHPAARADV